MLLEIDVANAGSAFLPTLGTKMPDPMSESGRGVALIEAMMDSVEFQGVEREHTGADAQVPSSKNKQRCPVIACDGVNNTARTSGVRLGGA